MKINFEDIPRSNKLAFLNGALCAAIASYWYTRYRNKNILDAHAEEIRTEQHKWHKYGFDGGWESARWELKRYIDMDRYERMYGPWK